LCKKNDRATENRKKSKGNGKNGECNLTGVKGEAALQKRGAGRKGRNSVIVELPARAEAI